MNEKTSFWKNKFAYLVPRIAVTILVYFLIFSNVRDFSYIINSLNFGYGSLNKEASLAVSSAIIIIFIWLAYDVLVSIASSLGYRGGSGREFVITGNTGVINLPAQANIDQKEGVSKQKYLLAQYEPGKPLAALSQARERIHFHMERLQNSSIVNLFIGIAIAFIGIGIVGSTFFEIEKYADKISGFNTTGFLTFVLLPRLSIALIVQVFSFFFLIMYRSNVNDIRYFQNEITNIDSISAALACLKNESDTNIKLMIASLLKTERNRLAAKNQKIINPSNDEEIITRLTALEGKVAKQKVARAIHPGVDG